MFKRIEEAFGPPKKDFSSVNQDRLLKEAQIVFEEMVDGVEYYQHIIKNVDVDRTNPYNSFLLFLYGKVDNVRDEDTVFLKAKNSLPDIDMDFGVDDREDVINYIVRKYGKDCVGQVTTLGTLSGRSAIKEVLATTDRCDFSTAVNITKSIPAEASVADDMKDKKEKSIIMYVLKYMPELLRDYVTYEDGELRGEFADSFALALEIEGSIKSYGKHAAAVIISDQPLSNIYPLMKSADGETLICGHEYTVLEKMGALKVDILGVAALTKLMTVANLLKYGRINAQVN